MGTLIIRHKVKDYSKWRPWFDQHAAAQKLAGLTDPRVFRSSDDENEVVILFHADDMKRAKDFVASPDLKQTMVKVRGHGQTNILFFGITQRPESHALGLDRTARPARVG